MGHEGVVSGYEIFIGIPRLISDRMDPRVLGCHSLVSEHMYAIT